MAFKSFNIESVGVIDVYKRRGTKRVNLRVVGNKIRVTQPPWLPYKTGLQFANKNKQWIITQLYTQPKFKLKNGTKVIIFENKELTEMLSRYYTQNDDVNASYLAEKSRVKNDKI